MAGPFVTAAAIAAIVIAVDRFFRSPLGIRVGRFAPEPFWIYFLSIGLGLSGLAPAQSPVYSFSSRYVLPAAIFLMLVGSPVSELVRLGKRASIAMALAAGTMVIAVVGCFAVMGRWLPPDSWKACGALMGTWIGGSANMVAVKEILEMPDGAMAPLIIVDTLLSYAWLALLLVGPAFQARFDRPIAEKVAPPAMAASPSAKAGRGALVALPLAVAALVALGCSLAGGQLAAFAPAVSGTGWALLLATVVAMVAALTPLRRLDDAGASACGRLALYVVLATIGARTQLQSAAAAPAFLAFGAAILLTHGVLLLALSRLCGVSLFLAATASQANVGGAVSAPIVAEAYRPGSASVGVLMAVAGALFGTYVGVAGGWICRWVEAALR